MEKEYFPRMALPVMEEHIEALQEMFKKIEDEKSGGFYKLINENLIREIYYNQGKGEKLIPELMNKIIVDFLDQGIKFFHSEARAKSVIKTLRTMYCEGGKCRVRDDKALRFVVNGPGTDEESAIRECYRVAAYFEGNLDFVVLGDRTKDFIKTPKPCEYNPGEFYRALHLSVIWQGELFEIQLRTYKMHIHAEYEGASHVKYDNYSYKGVNISEINGLKEYLINPIFFRHLYNDLWLPYEDVCIKQI